MALVAEDSLATADNHEAKMSQDGANQDRLKMAQAGPKMRQDGQNELKWTQDKPKLPQDEPRWPQDGPPVGIDGFILLCNWGYLTMGPL